jgi:ERCC4-related helicase
MLAQVAQAKRERELLALTERCHPQNLRQLRWANTMIKVQTPQILNSMG